MEAHPESADRKKVEFEFDFGYTMQGAPLYKNDQGKQKLTGDYGGVCRSRKAVNNNNNESDISASDNRLKDEEKNPSLDHEEDKETKVEWPRAFDNKDFEYMTDFDEEKKELKSEFSNSVQKIYTEQDDSSGGQQVNRSHICVTQEFDDRIVEEEVEHAFGFKDKKKKDQTVFDLGESVSESHQEVYKDGNINDIKTVHRDPCDINTCKDLPPGKTVCDIAEKSDTNNFISVRKNKTFFKKLSMIRDCFWNCILFLPKLLSLHGHLASNDGPTHVSSQFTQVIGTECRHTMQRDTHVQSQNEVSLESHTLGALTIDTGSPAFSTVTNFSGQPQIVMAYTSGQVTLQSFNRVSGREATSSSQSHELMMVLLSADEKNAAKALAAEQSLFRRQVLEKSEILANPMEFKEHQKPDIESKINQDQGELNSKMNCYISKSWNKVSNLGRSEPHSYRWKCILDVILASEFKDTGQFTRENESKLMNKINSVINGHFFKECYDFMFFEDCKQRHIKMDQFRKLHRYIDDKLVSYIWQLNYRQSYICTRNSISVFVVAIEPRPFNRQNVVNIAVTGAIHVARQVDGQNVLTTASQTVDGELLGRGVSNNSSQESQGGMDGRVNDSANSPAFPCNDMDTGFTDAQLASGRVTVDARQDSGLTLPSALVQAASGQFIGESDSNITSEQLLRASDVSRITPLPEARFPHSSGDTRCRDEEDTNGLQTDADRYVSDLSQLPETVQAGDGQPFHIAAARSIQPSEVSGINNKPPSPVNSHRKRSDTESFELPAIGSTDPENGSATEQTYTVHVPTKTSNQDDSFTNQVEVASMNLASGGISNTREEASERGENENGGDATSIQQTGSAQLRCPQYGSRDLRMNSFQGWPARLRQRPEEMAECGFYYAGFGDCVRCFYCGVGLQQWMYEDDPWFEHARWSPSCFYVCKIKGNDFVSTVQAEMTERETARKNARGNDSNNNGEQSADGKKKDTDDKTEETAIEHDHNTDPEICPELYDATICRICLHRKRSVVFLPCAHFGACTSCSHTLQRCPFCRELIIKKQQIVDFG